MWDAAKTVAAQLVDFINKKKIDDLVINTPQQKNFAVGLFYSFS